MRLYGRDTEVSTLIDIVCNNLAMIVFGRSGIGKSSLIHAGLSPEIRKKGMTPIYIRFEHNTETSYTHQIEKAICSKLETEDRLGMLVPQMGLWDFFHRNLFFNKNHQPTVPVIIIDQFEEIYTLADAEHKHQAQELFEELADLLNNIKPAKIMAYEDKKTEFSESKVEMEGDDVLTFRIHANERLNYLDDSNFHLVICLREDYLYYLERNTSKIPSFKVNRFSLHALNRKTAQEVIMLPKPGVFSSDEADDIISKISTTNDESEEEIDPTILSIFLFKYYNSKGNVKTGNIINEFYADETQGISRTSLAYLEDNLITGEGFRHIVPYNDAIANGVTKQELDLLISSRILTIETRKKHDYIEFSHDVLCPIAKEHREQRKIEEQARKLRKRVLAATGVVLMAFVLIFSFLYLNHQVIEKDRTLTITQAINNSNRAHYMIVQGDVLNAIKLLLNVLPDYSDDDDYTVLPETERALNEAYDSLYSDYSCIAILKHTDDVTTAEYSEDNKYIITASNDGLCRIWNSQSGEKLHELRSDLKNMTGASLNKDGSKAITSFRNGSVLIWDVGSEQITTTLKGHSKAVNYACFSPDGRHALTASNDGTVKLWNATTGKCIKTIVKHTGNVNCALFSSDGKQIISSSEDGTSIVCDLKSLSSRTVFSKKDCSVEYAEFNYNDTKMAVVTSNAAHIIDVETGKTDIVVGEHRDLITSASFSPDGKTIATSSYDKTIKIWDITTGKIIHTYSGHSNIVKDVVYSPNGRFVLSTSSDNEARIWNVETQASKQRIHNDLGILNSVTYSPDGKYLAAISVDGKARIWNMKTKKDISSFNIPEIANSITFNKYGDKVVVAADCSKIRVYDVRTGLLNDSVTISEAVSFDCALFADDNKTIVAFSHEGPTVKYDTSQHSVRLIEGTDSITSFSFSDNDSICLISPFNKESFYIRNLKQSKNLKSYEGHAKEVFCVKYSHDLRKIVSGSSDNTAIIWDVDNGSIIHKLKKHSSQIYFADFSFDDRYVITASTDGTVRIWNVNTGEDVAIRYSSTAPRYRYMFCPNSSQYVIANDNYIQICDLLKPKNLIQHFKLRYKNVELTQEERVYYAL